MPSDYWEECIAEAAEDAGVDLSKEQIDTIASWAESAHENYGMAHGYDVIPNPREAEIKRLEAELKKERDKIVCPTCKGGRVEVTQGPHHCGISQCFTCKGEGKVLPYAYQRY